MKRFGIILNWNLKPPFKKADVSGCGIPVSSFMIDTTTTGMMISSIWENPCRLSMATNGPLCYLPNLSYPEGSGCTVRQPLVRAYTCIRSVTSSKLVGLKPLLTLLCLNLKRKYLMHVWVAISQAAVFFGMCFLLSLVNPRRFPRPSHTSNIQIISNHHKSISLQRELGHGVVKFQMHWGIFFRYFHVCQVTLQTATAKGSTLLDKAEKISYQKPGWCGWIQRFPGGVWW